MKRYIRETHQILEGLGFTRHDDPFGRTDRATYTHPYEPETRIAVYVDATEAACKAIQAKGHQIAGLGSSSSPKTVGERKKIQRKKMSSERSRQAKVDDARRERADAAESEYQATCSLERAARHLREVQSWMRPGGGR